VPSHEEFVFDANASGVSGRIGGNEASIYPVAALAARRGSERHKNRLFGLGIHLRIEEGEVRTLGAYEPESQGWNRIAVAELRGMNISDIVRVDRLVTRLAALDRAAGEPEYFLAGSIPSSELRGRRRSRAGSLRFGSRTELYALWRVRPQRCGEHLHGYGSEPMNDGNALLILWFGKLTLAEILTGLGWLSLTMLRVELDGEERGRIQIGGGDAW
jgi:hypothetical protein